MVVLCTVPSILEVLPGRVRVLMYKWNKDLREICKYLYLHLFVYRLVGGKDSKVIYRHYATLYFVFVVDSSESELGILDLIQVGVHSPACV